MKKAYTLAVPLCLVFASCGGTSQTPEERTVFAMDTAITLTAYGENAAKALEKAENEIHHLDTMMSRAGENGDIYLRKNLIKGVGISHENKGNRPLVMIAFSQVWLHLLCLLFCLFI